jgi:hypothetical protein
MPSAAIPKDREGRHPLDGLEHVGDGGQVPVADRRDFVMICQ